ncbi:MAG: hypothetical protein VX768_14730, partial [Planctomycetota bacterium]|nr:hypothetical protein [Planctomycetota bacterium]
MNETASWLECPVCEYRFSVPPEYLDKSGKCPKCEKVFHAADCQLPEKAPGNDPAEPDIPEPMAFEGLETETGETAAPSPPPPPVPPGKATGQTEEAEKEIDYNQSYVTADKKRTDPNRVLLLVAGSCALAIALLIGIPMIANMVLSRKPSPETANAGVNANSPQPNGQKTTGQSREASNRPGGQPPAQKTGGAKKRKKKAKKSQLAPFTVAELENLWKNCHSSIVLVNAKKGDQSTTSHGVVVSTDGKIAVSLSQVQGAESVRVRFADALYGGEKRWGKSAFATNILNTNPSLNLAIIQVPRKTVPATARSKPIGQNERGVVPVLVNKNSDDYLRMTRLSPPQPYSSLAESSRTSLVSMDMEPQKNDYFTVHSARVNKNGVGVPVFDEQAKLVGVHVSHDEDAKSSFLVPYAPISKLVNDPTA